MRLLGYLWELAATTVAAYVIGQALRRALFGPDGPEAEPPAVGALILANHELQAELDDALGRLARSHSELSRAERHRRRAYDDLRAVRRRCDDLESRLVAAELQLAEREFHGGAER